MFYKSHKIRNHFRKNLNISENDFLIGMIAN